MQQLPNSLDATLGDLREALDGVSADSSLQEGAQVTLVELDHTLRRLRELIETLNEQPNAIIFSRAPSDDPVPPSGLK